MVNHEDLNWLYLISCDVKEGKNDTTVLKIYDILKISTDTLRQIQPDEEKSDDENLRKATKEVEAVLIAASRSVRVNNGTLLIAHSIDKPCDKEVEERLNSKPYSYVKRGIVLLKT